MRRIVRKKYLDLGLSLIGSQDIKVITGVRRCGKSCFLDDLTDYVMTNYPNSNVIKINFNDFDWDFLRDGRALHSYVMKHYVEGKQNFLFVDEVQMCDGFERVLNSLHSKGIFDIYVTGSNAFLLSSDLATLFTGRTFPVEMFPFSYSEYLTYFDDHCYDKSLDEYVRKGGMAGSYIYGEDRQRDVYLKEVFDTLILRDIRQKFHIRNQDLLVNVTEFLMDNIGNFCSAKSIANAFVKSGTRISDKTVGKYIEHLCNAFLFYRVRRYDLRGKKYLSANDKYYLADTSFRLAVLGNRNADYGRIYENIVAIELLRRGYQLYVGVLYDKEIDFVAQRGDDKLYIQVAASISESATFAREVKSLLSIRDAYPKILLTRTGVPEYQYEGIRVIDIAEWLAS